MKINNDAEAVNQLRALACLVNVPHASRQDVETTQALGRRLQEIIDYMGATGRKEFVFDLQRFADMINETLKDFNERAKGAEIFPACFTFSKARFDNYWHDVLEEIENLQKPIIKK
jgi:hypothetical protein